MFSKNNVKDMRQVGEIIFCHTIFNYISLHVPFKTKKHEKLPSRQRVKAFNSLPTG